MGKLNSFFLKKNGQLFMLDLIFSFVILVVSVAIAFMYYSETSTEEELFEISQDVLEGLTTTSINSLNSVEVRDLFILGKIKNIDLKIAQQVAEFYYFGEIDDAKNLTKIFVESYDKRNLGLEVLMYNRTHNLTLYDASNVNVEFDDAVETFRVSRDIQTYVNYTLIGPYTMEVKVWH